MNSPVITVVVVCYNEEKNIERCLSALFQQGATPEYCVIVVDGGSTDRTRSLVHSWMADHSNLQLVENPSGTISAGRNIGWKKAQSTLIAFTDADCEVPVLWLRKLYHSFLKCQQDIDPNVVAVGGGNVPPLTTRFYRALSIFLSSYFGNRGSVQGKRLDRPTFVSHIPTLNLLYHREALESVDGFDETMGNIGEDEDLNYRLIQTGKKILYIPDCEVIHYQRGGLFLWMRRMFVYGRGRIQLMKKHTGLRHFSDFLPLCIPVIFFLIGFVPLKLFFLVPAVFYLCFFCILSLVLSWQRGRVSQSGLLWLLFFGTHLFYGLGMFRELLHLRR